MRSFVTALVYPRIRLFGFLARTECGESNSQSHIVSSVGTEHWVSKTYSELIYMDSELTMDVWLFRLENHIDLMVSEWSWKGQKFSCT